MMLNLTMRESVTSLGEVVVKPRVNKQMPLNEMAQVGARMFREHSAHHIILEYMKMRSFNGQTVNLKKRELEDKYTELTFPNIAYRIEF